MTIIKTIGIGIGVVFHSLGSIFYTAPLPLAPFGASFQTAEVRALFETSLASRISTTDTSFTLSSATDKDGTSLASSTYGFIIDEGTSVEELVIADCTGTTCTNATRGISARTGTSTVAALRFAHNRGASVKMTDAPILLFTANVFKGRQKIENPVAYDSIATTTLAADRNNIPSVGLLQDTAFNGAGVVDATQSAAGVIKLSSQLAAASSTYSALTGPRALDTQLSTSTYNAATAGLRVLVTQNNGKIDSNFLPSTIPLTSGNNTWTGINAFSTSTSATTTIGAFPAYEIGKHWYAITTTGTSTLTIPTGITRLNVWLCAAGGGGGNSGATTVMGNGGGAGGCAFKSVDVSATTSVIVFVGTGGAGAAGAGIKGTWTTFGVNGFYFHATPGDGGAGSGNYSATGSGTGVNGDLNLTGGQGWTGMAATGFVSSQGSYGGGTSMFGGYPAYGSGGPGGNNSNGTAASQGVIFWGY